MIAELIISVLCVIIIVVIACILYMDNVKTTKHFNAQIDSVVAQVNDVNYKSYRYDKKQQIDINTVDGKIIDINKRVDVLNKSMVEKEAKLNKDIKNVDESKLPADALVAGTPLIRTDKIQLGDQHLLSGVGDSKSGNKPDGWLRLMDAQGRDYRGGIGSSKLYVHDESTLNGTTVINGQLQVTSPPSDANPKKLSTLFGNNGPDNKNIIGGDTDLLGNIRSAGNVHFDKNINLTGRLHFKDPLFNIQANLHNNSDPFYIEKKIDGIDKSSLRLTINNDLDDSFQIWGNACKTIDCTGEGEKGHEFKGSGDIWNKGVIESEKTIARKQLETKTKATWMNDIGDIYAKQKIGVGIAPENMGNYKFFVDGNSNGVENNWNTAIKNGKTQVSIAHDGGYGIQINTNKSGEESALQVYSTNGELLNIKNDGNITMGINGVNTQTNIKSMKTGVQRHIDATNPEKSLYAGWFGNKVVLGNNSSGGEQYASKSTPLTNSIVSTNPHYVQKKLVVDKTKDDKYPQDWSGGIHSSFVYGNNIIGAGKDGKLAAYMNADGDLYTVKGAITGSDIRLKKDINNLTKDEIEKINNLRPVSYTLKDDSSNGKKYGFIAQDVEKIYPDIVTNNKDGIKGVNYDAFVPLVVGNIQTIKKVIPDDKQLCIGKTCITERDLINMKKIK